ncbi:MAG: hypothetical protein U1F66_03555 [bacterium]
MSVYCTLLFSREATGQARLKQWLMKMGSELHAGDPLFSYEAGDRSGRFQSPGAGILKVYLLREGETLSPGTEVAVLHMPEAQAQDLERRGLGKILTPEELKSTLEHAEAASIRLPPEEL